jgi:hypothetical protein
MSNPSYQRIEISPMPAVPEFDVKDRAATLKANDEYFHEQLIRTKEIQHLRNKLKWCYQREGN